MTLGEISMARRLLASHGRPKLPNYQYNNMNKTILCLAIAMVSGAASALAIPTTLSVDFRSAAWQSAAGHTSYSVGNVNASAVYPWGSTLAASSTRGIGVNVPLSLVSADILNTTFSLGSGNGLTGVWVTNLFSGTLESGTLVLDTTNGIEDFFFSGTQSQSQNPLGDVYVSFGGAYNVLGAEFFEAGLGSKPYSVAGFTSVPDGGATLTLLGIGLVSLTAFRRRFAM
jgi:hypothetical protein